ncbi:hypothetical protein EIP91_004963 [Steccherinum ochraceum]|uniref:Thioredoxin domain-containing protein n=1 Tax=Steccherinum ochraceum TaxID=92696 RepID=A0A4R0R7W4_9APHY|nr:hypothetical protein EIP91_004963 [Steccherinum ochraceum]
MTTEDIAKPLEVGAIEDAKKMKVKDKDGNEVTFGSLLEKQDSIVVFIRHFFCGVNASLSLAHVNTIDSSATYSQAFAEALASVRPEALEKADKQLFLVGCGEPELIEYYHEKTGFKYPIYADPKRAIFTKFGLVKNINITPKGETKRSYLPTSMVMSTLTNLWRGPMHNPTYVGKQGHIPQNGGDFVFTKDGTCTFSWRMRHTQDHVEVADLMREAGVEFP